MEFCRYHRLRGLRRMDWCETHGRIANILAGDDNRLWDHLRGRRGYYLRHYDGDGRTRGYADADDRCGAREYIAGRDIDDYMEFN